MGQLEVDAEAGGLHRFGVIEEEFLVHRRILRCIGGVEVEGRSGDDLDLVPAQRGAEAKVKLARLALGGDFGLRDLDPSGAEQGAARMTDCHLRFRKAQFVDRRMRVAVAAHGGIAQRQNAAGVGPGKALQRVGALGREQQRLARQVGNIVRCHLVARRIGDEALRLLPGGQRRLAGGSGQGRRFNRLRHKGTAFQHAGGQQPVGIVERGPKDLAAGNILEGGRDAAVGEELILRHRFGNGKARLRGAPGPQQQHGLIEVAAGLGQRQRRQIFLIKRGLAHDPADQPGQGLADLRHALRANGAHSGPVEPLGLVNSPFPATGCDISHQSTSIRVERGRPITLLPSAMKRSKPSG